MATNPPQYLGPYSRFKKEAFPSQVLRALLSKAHRLLRGIANNLLDKRVVRPREFSNAILKYYAPIFTGDVINVSGWKDGDFEGGHYRDYFVNAKTYSISNAPVGENGPGKGVGSIKDELCVDLSNPLPGNLEQRFDVVFNHTTLEHVFEVEQAFKNLCALSREAVIVVVPTIQQIHIKSDFGDYNRLTPIGVAKYFEQNGFETIVLQSNEQPFSPIYCFAIAVRNGSEYKRKILKSLDFSMGGALYGSPLNTSSLKNHLQNC